jgi:hypothetical protein
MQGDYRLRLLWLLIGLAVDGVDGTLRAGRTSRPRRRGSTATPPTSSSTI